MVHLYLALHRRDARRMLLYLPRPLVSQNLTGTLRMQTRADGLCGEPTLTHDPKQGQPWTNTPECSS